MHSLTRTLTLALVLAIPALALAQPYHDRHRGRDDRDYREDRWDDRYDYDDDWDEHAKYDRRYKRRRWKIPRGHYPPPGLCRVWYPNRPPGHQPPPVPCGRLVGRHLGHALVVTHHGAFHTWRDAHRYYDAPRRHRRGYMKKWKKLAKRHGHRRYHRPNRWGPKGRIRIDIGGVWIHGF